MTALAIGPQRLDDTLRLALSLGAGRAIRVGSEHLHGADVAAAARLTGRLIEILAPDLVVSGSRLLDKGDDPTLALAAAQLGRPLPGGDG